jgi:hypothetical protein
VTDLKNATRERERSSPGEREEAKMDRSTAGVTGMRLVLRGLSAPGSGSPANVVVLAAALACAADDAESGYGRCDDDDDETGVVVVVVVVVETVAAAYVAGVMVDVLGVELGGVRLELELLERTEDEGDATIVRYRIVSYRIVYRMIWIELNCYPIGIKSNDGRLQTRRLVQQWRCAFDC